MLKDIFKMSKKFPHTLTIPHPVATLICYLIVVVIGPVAMGSAGVHPLLAMVIALLFLYLWNRQWQVFGHIPVNVSYKADFENVAIELTIEKPAGIPLRIVEKEVEWD